MGRVRIPNEELSRRAVAYVDRRGGALIRRGGRGGGGQGKKPDPIAAMQPRHWYRADTVTLSGGNLATMPNRGTAGGHLAVAAGTIAAPSADASFNNAPSVVFTGAQRLNASHPASEFKFTHSGEAEIIAVFQRTSVANNAFFLATYQSGPGFDIVLDTASNYSYRVHNGTTYIASPASAGALIGNGAVSYIDVALSVTAVPNVFGFTKDVASFTAALSGATNANNPENTLSVGARSTGGITFFSGKLVDLFLFDRRLTPYERQLMREYIARYGIPAPVWSAEDRQILQLNPFSWVRADYYASASGKVTAFLDKVLPGHSMAQGTAANQVADPTADAVLGGKLAALFTGAQQYRSTLPVAAWDMFGLLNKAYAVLCVCKPTVGGTSEHWLATRPAAGGAGFNLLRLNTGAVWHLNQKTSTSLVNSQSASTYAANIPLLTLLHASGPANTATLRVNKAQQNISALTGAPDGTAQADTLTLGARYSLNSPSNMAWTDAVILDRVPSAQEIATLEAYAGRYGL